MGTPNVRIDPIRCNLRLKQIEEKPGYYYFERGSFAHNHLPSTLGTDYVEKDIKFRTNLTTGLMGRIAILTWLSPEITSREIKHSLK